MKQVLFVFGTRPEAIKMAPIILEMQKRSGEFKVHICVTSQHRELLAEPLEVFCIQPDIDLGLMRPDQSLFYVTSELFSALHDRALTQIKPDWILVQGDTTTTMAGAVSGFYQGIPVGHVEAGLRTYRMDSPFPEEFNRRVCSLVATRHYCPTGKARDNLINEGIPEDKILVTGNTSIDALHWVLENHDRSFFEQHIVQRNRDLHRLLFLQTDSRKVLVTLHRREHFGGTLRGIFGALTTLAGEFPEVQWIYPVHPNPNVLKPAREIMGSVSNVHLVEPLDYLSFVCLMEACEMVVTDSGGVQEEAPALGKPVLVIRQTTERPEAIEAGTALLVGTAPEQIISNAHRVLEDRSTYEAMARAVNPFGDGTAARQIADDISDWNG